MTGPTVNLLPVVIRVDQSQKISAFLDSVRSQAAKFMPYEQTGMSKIRRYLTGKTSSAVTDFQTLFVVHAADFGEAAAPILREVGLEYISEIGKTEQHAFPLVTSLMLAEHDTATLKLQYDERVLSKRQISNINVPWNT